MTGPLALVGGGEWTDGCTFDAALLDAAEAVGSRRRVAVLPTGAAYENPAELVRRARSWFAGLGAEVDDLNVLNRRDALDPANLEAVLGASFVYLAGTSPMHLRSVLKDSPLWDALVTAWASGTVLAGTGAGADVLCDPMVDTRGGAFTVGLGLVPGLAVIPRVDEWSPDKVHRTVELAPEGVPVVELPAATALLRDSEGNWRAEGVGQVTVHLDGAVAGLDVLPREAAGVSSP